MTITAGLGDDTANFTLDEMRIVLAPGIADAAVFDGWTDAALVAAAQLERIDPDVARLAFPGGAMDMIAAWTASVDLAMAKSLTADKLATMKIRVRIRSLVEARLAAIAGREEALRRALAIMAMPQNVLRAGKLGWASADAMWRLAGDTATDYNHYTKRAILGSLYASTLAVFVADESDGKSETRAFLDRGIEGVMRFEKLKAQLLRPSEERFSIARFLGRLRYPVR